jgi:energy-coupling factor transport system permease protein
VLDQLPVGTYIPVKSFIHRLRARTKLLLVLWLAMLFFFANRKHFHFGAYLAALVVLTLAALASRIPFAYIWRRLRFILILLIIGLPFVLIWTPGVTWQTFGPIVITYDGLWLAMSYTAIFLLLYVSSMLLTMTTTPVALSEGVVLLFRPLKLLRIPTEEFGLMTLISLRFFPVIVQEAEQLVKAQVSRGAAITSGHLFTRIRDMGSLLVPMMQGALRRAAYLSAALDSRGYGFAADATLLHEGRFGLRDWFVLLLVPIFTAALYWKL